MDTQESWVRPLAAAVIVLLVFATIRAHPAPGLHGRPLAIAIALGIFVLTLAAVPFVARAPAAVQVPLMSAVAVSAAMLLYLQPSGPGFVGVIPVVSGSALRLPPKWSVTLLLLGVGAVAAAYAVDGRQPVWGVMLNELAIVGFFVVSTFARRYRENNERTEQLLVELKETRKAQELAAALAERQRLAREMHDVLAHSLSGLVLNLEGARLLIERDGSDPALVDAIGKAQRMAKYGLEEARRAIGMLRDDVLPGLDQIAALAHDFESDTGIACALAVDGERRELGPEERLALYRVAQEALTNIRKHASAERVEIKLSYGPAAVRLGIENIDSLARASSGVGGSGYGLTGMRERAELLGGTLTAGPTDKGFRVDLTVPA